MRKREYNVPFYKVGCVYDLIGKSFTPYRHYFSHVTVARLCIMSRRRPNFWT